MSASAPEARSEPPTVPPTVAEFERRAAAWKRDTRYLSSATQMAAHPAYREIVAMGRAALPLILADLRREPHFWFSALREITGEDPVRAEDRGKVEKMRDAWLRWGEANGFGPVR
jgi:hypothetical protein